MSKEIFSKTIGQLIQDRQLPSWWKSAATEIPFFGNQQLTITFTDFDPEADTTFMEEADVALTNFLSLTNDDRKLISKHAYDNCMQFLDTVDRDEADNSFRQIVDENEIWNFIQPTEIFLARRYRRDKDIYLSIDCECDWEREHGLQLVFRQGKKLTRISSIDGHLTEADAYDSPDEKDALLSNF